MKGGMLYPLTHKIPERLHSKLHDVAGHVHLKRSNSNSHPQHSQAALPPPPQSRPVHSMCGVPHQSRPFAGQRPMMPSSAAALNPLLNPFMQVGNMPGGPNLMHTLLQQQIMQQQQAVANGLKLQQQAQQQQGAKGTSASSAGPSSSSEANVVTTPATSNQAALSLLQQQILSTMNRPSATGASQGLQLPHTSSGNLLLGSPAVAALNAAAAAGNRPMMLSGMTGGQVLLNSAGMQALRPAMAPMAQALQAAASAAGLQGSGEAAGQQPQS